MTSFFRRHSLQLTALALLVCSFQLMAASLHNTELPKWGARVVALLLSPFELGYSKSARTGRELWEHYVWLLEVERERDELNQRIQSIESQNSALLEYKNENERLRRLLQYPESADLQRVPAAVVGRDPSNWIQGVTIDRGNDDGVAEGMAVVDGVAVVGQVVMSTARTSKIMLLTDSTSAIDAIVQSSRAQGIVEGVEGRKLELRYVIKDYTVQTGDRVIASGLDGIFPKGTLIGVVTDVRRSSTGIFQQIDVQPSVDLSRLENVLVLTPKNPGKTRSAESPAGTSAGPAGSGQENEKAAPKSENSKSAAIAEEKPLVAEKPLAAEKKPSAQKKSP